MKTYREKHEINCKMNYDDARKHLHTNTWTLVYAPGIHLHLFIILENMLFFFALNCS